MKAPRKRRPTTDSVEILHRLYFEGKPARSRRWLVLPQGPPIAQAYLQNSVDAKFRQHLWWAFSCEVPSFFLQCVTLRIRLKFPLPFKSTVYLSRRDDLLLRQAMGKDGSLTVKEIQYSVTDTLKACSELVDPVSEVIRFGS